MKGYGTSHCHQASIASLPSPPEGQRPRKRATVSTKLSACSISGWCPAPAMSSKRAPGMQLGVGAAIGRRHEAVAGPPHHQRRHADAAEPPLELGVVHVGVPAIETERIPVAGPQDELLVRHRVVVGRPSRRIVPRPAAHLGRRGVEDVEDVGRLTVADLDAERVHEDEAVETMPTRHRDLGREPATE